MARVLLIALTHCIEVFKINAGLKCIQLYNVSLFRTLYIEDYTYWSRRTLTSETRLGPVLIGQYTRVNVY